MNELAAARIVGRYWVRSILESESLRRTGMSHPVACVMAALDGETDPAGLGVADDSPEAEELRALASSVDDAMDFMGDPFDPTWEDRR